MSVSPSENRPIVLANSCTKSRAYFRTLRWQGRRHCPACQYWRKLYRLDDGRFKCAQCHYRFSEWTGTYLERLRIPLHELAHLLYLFTLLVSPALTALLAGFASFLRRFMSEMCQVKRNTYRTHIHARATPETSH